MTNNSIHELWHQEGVPQYGNDFPAINKFVRETVGFDLQASMVLSILVARAYRTGFEAGAGIAKQSRFCDLMMMN